MRRAIAAATLSLCFAVGGLWVVEAAAPTSTGPRSSDQFVRRTQIRMAAQQPLPSADLDTLVDQSNAARETYGDEGVRAILEVPVEPDEAAERAYFDAHRELFGRRTFTASQEAIRRVLHLSGLKAELLAKPAP